MPSKYETDYYAWAMETAAAMREGRLADIDFSAVAEEIEDLGKSERRSLASALEQLFLHLLKLRFQRELATRSWEISVRKQRRQVKRLVTENPSLRPLLSDTDFLRDVYTDAVLGAMEETGLPENSFPEDCPFGLNDMGI